MMDERDAAGQGNARDDGGPPDANPAVDAAAEGSREIRDEGPACDCPPPEPGPCREDGVDADPADPRTRTRLQRRVFLVLLVLITGAFLYVLRPFFGPILWACVLAIVFSPIQKRLARLLGNRPGLSSILTLLLAIVICVVPLLFILRALYGQVMDLYKLYVGGGIDVADYVGMFDEKLPAIRDFMVRIGVEPESLVRQATDLLSSVGSIVAKNAGRLVGGTARFMVGLVLMLYLAFFMLRDGGRLTDLLIRAAPVENGRERLLVSRFTGMVRAMVKGTLVIATMQGLLGGTLFWALGIRAPVLWGVVMTFTAMIPMLGTWIVWLPFAIYLLIAGAWQKALILALVGAFVIGLIDNLLRPRLVGRETRMPDWVVLFSTLGGLVVFGISGFIVGPVVAALFLAFWQMFAQEYS